MNAIKRLIQRVFFKNTSINGFLVSINGLFIQFTKLINRGLYKTQYYLYGGGSIRLSTDHDITVNLGWPLQGSILWAECASFALSALYKFEKKNILDLGCANGWYFREFFSNINNVFYVGCDISEDIIAEAMYKLSKASKQIGMKTGKKLNLSNAQFITADILNQIPGRDVDFTNIFWFSSMCMFTFEQRKLILHNISEYLQKSNGILSGNIYLVNPNESSWKYYIALYNDETELRTELSEYFVNICIIQNSDENTRFFMASNGNLPYYNKVL